MKKTTYYLAIDFGASSGRHILGWLEDGKMQLKEVYRFPNGMIEKNGKKCWDTEALFAHIIEGMKKCHELGMDPSYMGVDTWGVDFVLLDREGKRLGEAVGYRDNRTQGMDEEVYRIIPADELYRRTGIQKAIYNTIYQLMALKKQEPELLEKADALLMTPDYYSYLLTGKKSAEYTISTTGQLVSPTAKDWDFELIERLGFPKHIFQPIRQPGTVLAPLSDAVSKEVGFQCQVVSIASHDTASAVLAVPSKSANNLYISSGTWSLMGVELQDAICTDKSKEANITNEGGYGKTYRFLKNIMGLWMIQSVRHEYNDAYSFDELCQMAEEAKIASLVDANDDCFFAPDSMIEAIRTYCKNTDQQVPQTTGEVVSVVYRSLADYYAKTAKQFEEITGKNYAAIHIVGGGCNADYLNRLTAQTTGKTVYAGPGEATAIGNISAQMLCDGVFADVSEVRECIYHSFDIKKYK